MMSLIRFEQLKKIHCQLNCFYVAQIERFDSFYAKGQLLYFYCLKYFIYCEVSTRSVLFSVANFDQRKQSLV